VKEHEKPTPWQRQISPAQSIGSKSIKERGKFCQFPDESGRGLH
jgi:hypothetical protein